jgi:hypothetical protein
MWTSDKESRVARYVIRVFIRIRIIRINTRIFKMAEKKYVKIREKYVR